MNYTNNQNCNSNNYCGCGQQYPVVPGSNPSLQTWNGQRFVVADGSYQLPIYLPNLQQYDPTQVSNVIGMSATGQLVRFADVQYAPNNALVTATGSTTPRTLANRAADVVNVKDFGATGDGVTDDTAAIQAAINYFPNGANGTIIFPNGTYNISSTIFNNNRNLLFLGNESTIYLTANATYVFNLTGSGCTFQDFVISKAQGTTASAFLISGIRYIFNNIKSSNCIWTNFFYCQGLKESHFTKIRIDNDVSSKTGNIFNFDYSVNNTIDDCMFGYANQCFYFSTIQDPINLNYSEGFTITNCIVVFCDYGANCGRVTFLAITNCVFDFISNKGVFVSNGANNVISNSWFAANANSVIGVGSLSGVVGMTVIGNQFQLDGSQTNCSAVSLSGPNAVVCGNTYSMNGGVVTYSSSQVFGNTNNGSGTAISSQSTIVQINGNINVTASLTIANSLTVSGSQGIFPLGLSGTATLGANGALPATVAGYATVNISGTNYKVPYYNV
jgi:hypothetical protein